MAQQYLSDSVNSSSPHVHHVHRARRRSEALALGSGAQSKHDRIFIVYCASVKTVVIPHDTFLSLHSCPTVGAPGIILMPGATAGLVIFIAEDVKSAVEMKVLRLCFCYRHKLVAYSHVLICLFLFQRSI